ncbi:cytochrome b5 domain-containing protein [Clostridium sp. AL.422]|uniref:cytochrome b5 domain-containing protein n=1 Tax=Clostridium TaxID=1485 RepID=UPI00293DD42D|nr:MULTISPECIES: cytochrome b5 domain-containing protein [unclassified Clostridium]MDV4149850.1 cytochrome b5 domain-containing protein [Clostridium sp. AL.422]
MKKIFIAGILGIMIILGGCASKKAEAITSSISNSGVNAEAVPSNKEFNIEELSKYNGQNGNPAYIAVDGVVYDVTNAKGWSNGRHNCGVTAGKDLSELINQSPHGKEVLKNLPVVGTLK